MIDPSLTPCGVLVTRPLPQAKVLARLLSAHGFNPMIFPAMEIEKLDHVSLACPLSDYHKIIFISQNAVEHGLNFLDAPSLESVQVAAIGQKTAQCLQDRGIRVSFMPPDQYDSESLLALSQWKTLNDQRILIVRGQDGREFLADHLQQRGARVDYLEVYRRVCPDSSVTPILHQAKHWHITLATSTQIIDNLCQLFGADDVSLLYERPLLVVSQRIADYATQQGFQTIHLAPRASNEAILQTLNAC